MNRPRRLWSCRGPVCAGFGGRGRVVMIARGATATSVSSAVAAACPGMRIVTEPETIGPDVIGKARHVVVVVDGLASVTSLVVRIAELSRRRRGKAPLDLLLLSIDAPLPADGGIPDQARCPEIIEVRTLSLPQAAARLLLNRFPLHASADVVFGQPLHVLVAGFGALGRAITLQAMRLAHYGGDKTHFTIVDAEPQRSERAFRAAFPQAGAVAAVRFLGFDEVLSANQPVTSAYVCLHDRPSAVRYAARLRQTLVRQRCGSPPIYLHLYSFEGGAPVDAWDGQTVPFSAVTDVCVPEQLFDREEDGLAAIIHEYYRDSIEAQGRSLDETPSGRPWQSLSETYRQASRHQADHVPAKLAAIDCRAVAEEASELFVFRPLEAERLARIEHDRWSADRSLDGWRYGARRDNVHKRHPELVPYNDLSAEMKDLDRYAVRLMPVLLARQGRAVKRDLLIAVSAANGESECCAGFTRQIDAVLERLSGRFPDRCPVLALDPSCRLARAVGVRAVERFDMALKVLLTEPVATALRRLDAVATRRQYLTLLARAECRIGLTGAAMLRRWLSQRPDVLLIIRDERLHTGAENSSIGTERGDGCRRRVMIDPVTATTGWTFEY